MSWWLDGLHGYDGYDGFIMEPNGTASVSLVVSHGSWGSAGLPVPTERVDTMILRTECHLNPVSYQAPYGRRRKPRGLRGSPLPLGRDLDRSPSPRHARGNGALLSISFPPHRAGKTRIYQHGVRG